MTHFVKFREKGKKTWWYLGKGAEGVRLRMHALWFTEENAKTAAEGTAKINPEFEFKVVPVE